ncbi:MAG: hypothetical protein ACFFA6_13660 [Promethearchaeota archaeon]
MAEQRTDQQDTLLRSRSVSGVVLILLGVVLLSILAVGNALVLDALLGQFHLTWLAVMLGVEVVCIAGVLIRWPELRPTVRWRWLEVMGMIAVGGAFLIHAVYLAPSDLMPVSFSVDCSHQHLLVNYIYQNNGFPDNVDYLYIYDDYPVGPSALTAFLAHLTGVLPAQTMYLLAALFVTTQVMLAYGISFELLPRYPASYVLAALATLMIFLVYPYSVQVFAGSFYSNMIMGDLIVVLALWATAVRERLHPLLTTGITLILVLGCLNSYPAWLPFVVVPLVMSILLDQRMSVRRRAIIAGAVLILTVILAVVAIIDQWDFIAWFAPSRDRRLTPDWQSLGGIFLLFVGWGFWTLLRTWKQYFGLTLFLITNAALVVTLYGVAIMDMLTLYIPDKTFYFNVFLFTVLAALGLERAWSGFARARGLRGWIACVTMIVLAVAVAIGANAWFPPPNAYPITLDEYRVAYQTSQEMPDVTLTYLVDTNATFYWIYGCILNHTHDLVARNKQWQDNRPTYESWIQDAAAPGRAIVSDLTALPQDGRWRVIIQSGNSGVIEKVL